MTALDRAGFLTVHGQETEGLHTTFPVIVRYEAI